MDAARLHRLLDLYVDEGLAPDEHTELEQLLLSSPQARAIFWERARFNALLRESGTRSWGVRAAEQVPEAKRLVQIPWRRLAWIAAAAVLLFGGLATAWRYAQPVAEPTTNGVAMLGQTVDAVWDGADGDRASGAVLPPGWLRLKSGFAQIEFVSGARVVMQGPAELQLIAPLEAFCRVGRLQVEVPPQARGFRIGSPQVSVLDLGTAFGIEVQASGSAAVHVFRGNVELERGNAKRAVPEGHSVRVEADGAMRDFDEVPPDYPSSELLEARAATESRERLDAWRAAAQKFATMPGLQLYFTFEGGPTGARTLPNASLASGRAPDASIVGCRWAEGRWPGKRALEFRAVTDRVRLSVPGDFASATFAAWVRVDSLERAFNSLLMCDGWEEGEVHWQIARGGQLVLGVQGPHNRDGHDYRSPAVFPPERLAQWVHLAVVFDRGARRVSHFVDGQPVSVEPLVPASDHPLRLDFAELGNWNSATRKDIRPIRNLNGRMDEVLIFSRALSAAEVQTLYRSGRPPP